MKKTILTVFTLLIFATFPLQSIGWWGDDEDSETPTPATESSETQVEDSSFWGSLKDKVVEKTGSLKDKVVEKTGSLKDKIVEKTGSLKDQVVEKTTGLLDYDTSRELRFENVYDIPFWKNEAVFWSAIAVASAGAAAFTVYTAGTGAPAAGAGVSYVASQLVAGGGAGSYMAGLSTIGGWFGGNAITGAAILNATSAGLLGYAGSAGATKGITATTKLVLVSATKVADIGSFMLLRANEQLKTPAIQILPSSELGTEQFKELLTNLKEANNNLTETLAKYEEITNQLKSSFSQAKRTILDEYKDPAIEKYQLELGEKLTQVEELNAAIIAEKKKIEAERLTKAYEVVIQKTRDMIDGYLTNKTSSSNAIRTDAIMGAVLLHSLGYKKEFVDYIKQFEVVNQSESFLLYLKAIAHLIEKDFEVARKYAVQAMDAEPEAIEPIMVLMMIYDGLGQYQQALELEILLEEEFDDNHYQTPNTLVTAYNLLGDIANYHELSQTAAEFHKKAFDEMGFWTNDDKKALMCLKIANDYHMFGSKRKSTEYYEKAIGYVNDENLKLDINRFFKDEIQTQVVLK